MWFFLIVVTERDVIPKQNGSGFILLFGIHLFQYWYFVAWHVCYTFDYVTRLQLSWLTLCVKNPSVFPIGELASRSVSLEILKQPVDDDVTTSIW